MTQLSTQKASDETSVMTDDQQLVYTQHIRRGFIDEAVRTKTLFTGERGDKALVLQALNDMDRSALSNKKIKADSDNGEVNAKAAIIVTTMLSRMGNSTMREETPIAATQIPTLPDTVPAPILVPGEIDATAPPMTYKTFMKEQAKRLGVDTSDEEE